MTKGKRSAKNRAKGGDELVTVLAVARLEEAEGLEQTGRLGETLRAIAEAFANPSLSFKDKEETYNATTLILTVAASTEAENAVREAKEASKERERNKKKRVLARVALASCGAAFLAAMLARMEWLAAVAFGGWLMLLAPDVGLKIIEALAKK